uniref:Cyclin-dependent kinases regulatory subunit n=1 Tax=Crassostrea virginica TaxID=6565 RepID=A0A8B8E108_CRAVI|nr:cyclin-dependent kinases regulatory subunit 1-like [Crassostrea virginica]
MGLALVKTFSYHSGNLQQINLRHVMLPKEIAKLVPSKLMTETEWRSLGVQQSQGWIHYMKHDPEPHILLFRRPLPNNQPTHRQ